MSECEYDERTCITAGELRALGLAIPASIPDPGWVRRASIRWLPGKCTSTAQDLREGRFSISMQAEFTEPFEWISIRVETK